MFAFDTVTRAATVTQSARTTRSGACPSCGAYGGTQPQFSCQPGRRIKQGHMRRARRDARTSAAILEQARIQEDLIRGL
jgi:hypothetical protein